MKIQKSKIHEVDNSDLIDLISRQEHKNIINGQPGVEHYKLLRYVASLVNDSLIVELGTHNGTSSTAMSTNTSNNIITYDVRDVYSVNKQPSNVERRIGNIFDKGDADILLKSSFIFLDTAHLGDFELKVFNYLNDNGYKGLLILDDIHFNKAMKEFWNKIPLTKYDVSDVGHGLPNTGTGIVDFSNKLVIS